MLTQPLNRIGGISRYDIGLMYPSGDLDWGKRLDPLENLLWAQLRNSFGQFNQDDHFIHAMQSRYEIKEEALYWL